MTAPISNPRVPLSAIPVNGSSFTSVDKNRLRTLPISSPGLDFIEADGFTRELVYEIDRSSKIDRFLLTDRSVSSGFPRWLLALRRLQKFFSGWYESPENSKDDAGVTFRKVHPPHLVVTFTRCAMFEA